MAKIILSNFTKFIDGSKLKASGLINDRLIIANAVNSNQEQLYRLMFGDENNKVYLTKNDAVLNMYGFGDLDYIVVLNDETNNNHCTLYQYQTDSLILIYNDFSLKNIFGVLDISYTQTEVDDLLTQLSNDLNVTIDEMKELIEDDLVSVVRNITIKVEDWSNNLAVMAIEEVTVDNAIVIDLPEDDVSINAWHYFELKAISQSAGFLTFECTSTPNVDIDVIVLVGGVPAILGQTYLDNLTTDNLVEGLTNKYYSDALVNSNQTIIDLVARVEFSQTLVSQNADIINNKSNIAGLMAGTIEVGSANKLHSPYSAGVYDYVIEWDTGNNLTMEGGNSVTIRTAHIDEPNMNWTEIYLHSTSWMIRTSDGVVYGNQRMYTNAGDIVVEPGIRHFIGTQYERDGRFYVLNASIQAEKNIYAGIDEYNEPGEGTTGNMYVYNQGDSQWWRLISEKEEAALYSYIDTEINNQKDTYGGTEPPVKEIGDIWYDTSS